MARTSRDEHDLAARIKTWREVQGWTPTDLAARAKVSRQQIYKWERGTARPSSTVLERLHALGLPPTPPESPPPSERPSDAQRGSLDYLTGYTTGFREGVKIGIELARGVKSESMPSAS